jgi:ribosome recycling factor
MDLNQHKSKFEKLIEHLKVELSGIRTNRISPNLVENVMLVAYEGSPEQSLKELAAITAPEARQLLVEPWDKSIIKQIENALESIDVGFSLANEGGQIRLTMPIMTDEIRAQVRIKDDITKQEKDKSISEDDKFKFIKELDEVSKEYADAISALGDSKEAEISA